MNMVQVGLQDLPIQSQLELHILRCLNGQIAQEMPVMNNTKHLGLCCETLRYTGIDDYRNPVVWRLIAIPPRVYRLLTVVDRVEDLVMYKYICREKPYTNKSIPQNALGVNRASVSSEILNMTKGTRLQTSC